MRILLSFFILTLAFPAYAMDKGAKVGEKIPHNLNLKTQSGEITSFDELSGEKGLILFFVRSLDWCPYCQRQTIEIEERVSEFTDQGYNVAILSYDSVEILSTFEGKQNISFPLLSDPSSNAIRAFGILNDEMAVGTTFYGIPYPIVYLIAKDKTITNKFAEDGYKERPALDKILEAIDSK